ncbi:hypothetical protein K4L06_07120 [Lysobacter sp. BMK333-48F3]|uniref:hypothetical protein n=1 Tax=Lysobacter sp. BMK333-48F3 TaxID=2867962 RepID=UPI001C8B995F|nr:hypothetical protein [Lysobacter sp. BMK333-48F3]MBX9401080.1 hypothetical protein [Lysobacter sp. BMK333-48F3]
MRSPALLLSLLLSASPALAANDGPAGAIASVARATGMSYQFGTRCGFDADLLRRHRNKFQAEANTANAALPAGQAVDIEAEFQIGFDEANRFYDGIKDTPQRGMVCQQFALQIKQAVEHPSVLSLPTNGMRPR